MGGAQGREHLGADAGGAPRRQGALRVQHVGEREAATSSITIHGRPSCVATSWTVTTFRWGMRAAAHASRSTRA